MYEYENNLTLDLGIADLIIIGNFVSVVGARLEQGWGKVGAWLGQKRLRHGWGTRHGWSKVAGNSVI